ncbi:hypothetical protein GCM10009780_43870 [Actinomadura alba]
MGVMWHMIVGAPECADGTPASPSRAGEGPDDVVRLETRRSKVVGPYDPIPARRCGDRSLTPPEAASRTAASVDGDRGGTRTFRDRLAALLLGRDPIHPGGQW